MLQKHIDLNSIIINFSFHNFKIGFCPIKSDFNLRSSFLAVDFGHEGQSGALALTCNVSTLYQSKLPKKYFDDENLIFLVQHNELKRLVKLT